MITDPSIRQLTKKRDNMAHQIANHKKKIAYFDKRLASTLMPNQIAMLQAQRARQVTMLAVDQSMLINLEALLAAEITSQS